MLQAQDQGADQDLECRFGTHSLTFPCIYRDMAMLLFPTNQHESRFFVKFL